MNRLTLLAFALALAGAAHASWYWPFGSDDDGEERKIPRLSELMEGASTNIDAAVDFAEDGKTAEAVEAYRRALAELDGVERDYPELSGKPEFATLRNKRAYVNAAIDSLLLGQVKANAKAVAVSDTTELEKKLAAERAAKNGESPEKKEPGEKAKQEPEPDEAKPEPESEPPAGKPAPARPLSVRDRVIADIEKGDWDAAELGVNEMLVVKPNDAVALNLKAAIEAEQGKFKEAENTLDQAIMSNPRSPHAYYNMADLMLKRNPPNSGAARRYYETGRAMGGERDERLEAALK